MIGILCAIPEELAALQEGISLDAEPHVHGRTRVWTGTHGGQPVAVAISGIGKVYAAAAATVLLAVYDARALIFSGVAGGLNPDLPVGSVLLADRLATHDFGLVADGRFIATASGEIPIGAPPLDALTPVSAPVRATMVRLAERVGDSVRAPAMLGGVVTADYFLNCAATRDQLRASFGADAIDMESGAVFQIARAWDRPLYVIRTLSDLAGGDSHVTFSEMGALAARNSATCVLELLGMIDAGQARQVF